MHAFPHSLARVLALGALSLAASAALAAGQVRSVQAAPSSAPSAAQRAAAAAPKPAGLRPPLPAGLTDGSGAAVATDPVAANNAITRVPATSGSTGMTGTAGAGPVFNPGSATVDTTAQAGTTILGAGATVPGPSQDVNAGAGGYNAVDLARSFYMADANHDGELTSAEFSRLTIRPLGFQQMDRDFDGVISRFEYEDATQ